MTHIFGKILWVMFKKKVQFFESYLTKGFNSVNRIQKKRFISFSHTESKRGSILEGHIFHFFFWKKKKLKSTSLVQKKVQFFESCQKKKVHSFSHVKKGSIFWVIFQEEFNSLSHISWQKKKVQIFESFFKRVQFFESY